MKLIIKKYILKKEHSAESINLFKVNDMKKEDVNYNKAYFLELCNDAMNISNIFERTMFKELFKQLEI